MVDLRRSIRRIPYVQRLKWELSFLLWKARVKKNSDDLYDPYKTYWVPSAAIENSVIPSHMKPRNVNHRNAIDELGSVVDGDWDLEIMPFEDLDVYQSFKARLHDGKSWRETDLYRRVSKDINQGRECWGSRTIEEFEGRLEGLEKIYDDIKVNGYKTQEDLAVASPYGKEDEITVHISRHGDHIFANGRHRLTLAKLAGVEKVPVKIARRHADWVQFRQEILAHINDRASTKGQVYHQLTHPDLEDIPAGHGSQRMDMLRPYVPEGGGRLLDIGANWGVFSIGFEKLGFDCIAVEIIPGEAYFLKKLRRAEGLNFEVVVSSVFDLAIDMNFRVVLAMNIFHHFLKEKELFDSLCQLLERLDTDLMFFEPHRHDESQMQGAYRNFSELEFVQFVQEKTRLPRATRIGEDTDRRVIYKLEK